MVVAFTSNSTKAYEYKIVVSDFLKKVYLQCSDSHEKGKIVDALRCQTTGTDTTMAIRKGK